VARGDFSERCHVRNVHTALEIGREYIPSEGACMSVAKFFKRVEHTRGAVPDSGNRDGGLYETP
jgi:hypothetical protein